VERDLDRIRKIIIIVKRFLFLAKVCNVALTDGNAI
jgi:hypothetical protein